MTRSTRWVLATTAVAPVLFGTTYLVATSDLVPQHRPLLLAALRVVPAALVLTAIARPRLDRAALGKAMLIGSFNMGLFFAAFFVAADRLPNGIAATVSNTTPLFVLALSPLILREVPSVGRIAAGCVGVAGVAMLVGATPRGSTGFGVVCGLASAAILALGFVCTRRWLPDVRPIDSAAVQLLTGGALVVMLALLVERRPVKIDGGLVLGTVILALALTALPYVLLFNGILRLGPARVALLAPITPVVATCLGILFRNEQLTTTQAVGLVLVLGALLAAQRPERPVVAVGASLSCLSRCASSRSR